MKAALVTAAAFAALAAPAAAAPALAPLKPCYVAVDERSREAVGVSGSGFTPYSTVDVSRDGTIERMGVQTDAAGNLPFGAIEAPAVQRGRQPFTVTATERGNDANVVTLTSEVARLGVRVTPRVARPVQRVRLRGLGFTAPQPIYAHYVRAKKIRETVRLAIPGGSCGAFDVRRRQFPFRPRPGRWILQIDQQRRYDPVPSTAVVRIDIDVVRAPARR